MRRLALGLLILIASICVSACAAPAPKHWRTDDSRQTSLNEKARVEATCKIVAQDVSGYAEYMDDLDYRVAMINCMRGKGWLPACHDKDSDAKGCP